LKGLQGVSVWIVEFKDRTTRHFVLSANVSPHPVEVGSERIQIIDLET